MIESHDQAFDEINTVLLDAWTANSTTDDIKLVWANVVSGRHGQVDHFSNPDPYLLVETLYETMRTTSLKSSRGAKREHQGSLLALLHIQAGRGYSCALPLISVAQDAFTGTSTPGGVWFRNPRITNIGQQGTWYVMSMTVTFVYDLIR